MLAGHGTAGLVFGFFIHDLVLDVIDVGLAQALLAEVGDHDGTLHFVEREELERTLVIEDGGFLFDVVAILAIQQGDYFRFLSPWFLLGEGSELGEVLESSLVKKSAGFPWA